MTATQYIGRFAPTPSGRLHFGSMVTAVASWLDARRAGGHWFVRVDDLDPPREQAGAAEDIVRTLAGYGLTGDGPIRYQSSRSAAYAEALAILQDSGLAFGCTCSRRDSGFARIYPGTCRSAAHTEQCSWRLRVDSLALDGGTPGNGSVSWNDLGAGPQHFDLTQDVGDFILRRSDGLWGYHLACVVDDAHEGVTHIVRGADLIESTASHIALQCALDLSTPDYNHVPLALNDRGIKLSKQTAALPVEIEDARAVLALVFDFLGFPAVAPASPEEMLQSVLQGLLP